MTQVYYNKVS